MIVETAASAFLRRHKSTKANAREFHVHFRSRAIARTSFRLEQGSEVEFTLIDNHGRANARDVVPTGTVIELPPKQERWSRDGAPLVGSSLFQAHGTAPRAAAAGAGEVQDAVRHARLVGRRARF